MMETFGRHILVELWDCDSEILDSLDEISSLLNEAAIAAGAQPLGLMTRRFEPQGVTGILMVSESHFSIHTWPESGYAAIDAFTCGVTCNPMMAVEVFQNRLKSRDVAVKQITRGVRDDPQNLVTVL